METGFAVSRVEHSDPEASEAAVRGRSISFVVTRPGRYAARVMRAEVAAVWMQVASVSLPQLVHCAGPADRMILGFETTPTGTIVLNGRTPGVEDVVLVAGDTEQTMRHGADASWSTMSLSTEDFGVSCRAMLGPDIEIRDPLLRVLRPPPRTLARLRRMYRHVASNAGGAAHGTGPESIHSLASMLRTAMVQSVVGGHIHEVRTTFVRRAWIMAQLAALMADQPDTPFQVIDVCERLGVPLRTLQAVCVEFAGIGPKQYLTLRRLQLVNRDLRRARPGETSVTAVALRYGFWELGRFAGSYRGVFGEAPSRTLASRG